jgi:hypothetical protein
MTEEMKRQVEADYLLLAECRKCGWDIGNTNRSKDYHECTDYTIEESRKAK